LRAVTWWCSPGPDTLYGLTGVPCWPCINARSCDIPQHMGSNFWAAIPAVLFARVVSCPSAMLAMAAVDSIHKLVDDFENDKIGLVKASEQLFCALEAKDLVYKMFLDPRQVGMDPCNRDALGCNAQEVHLLASDIAFVGFSFEETTHAVCCEVKPGDPTVQHFNEMLVKGLDLAPVPPNSIKFGSLSCGHTNMALRCIAAGVASSCPLLSEGGHMDIDKLNRRDLDFGRAVTTGLQWRVLASRVRDDYPKVLNIIQAAKNVSGHLQRKIHEVQGMQQMHNLASAAQAAKQPVDWGNIKRAVLRSKPPFAESLDSIIQFIAVRSGGLDGHFLICSGDAQAVREAVPPLRRAGAPLQCPRGDALSLRCLGFARSRLHLQHGICEGWPLQLRHSRGREQLDSAEHRRFAGGRAGPRRCSCLSGRGLAAGACP
jgi:hypothetical protein